MAKGKNITELEKEFDVNSISFKGLRLWPVLRYYICVKHTANKGPVKANISGIKSFTKSLFYGLRYYFRKSDYLFLSSSDQRKKMNGLMIDKSVDALASKLPNSWIIELTTSQHFNCQQLKNKEISSKAPLIFITRIYSSLFVRKTKIQNESVLKDILCELDIDFDTYKLCKRHYAQYRVMKFFAKRKKWKAAFIVCHYTNMGYIKALHDLNIPVIEIQHGLISKKHCAYNLYTEADTSFYPDYLLTYGESEKSVFQGGNLFIQEKNVRAVGHSYLDFISKKYQGDDQLKKIISNYKYSVAVVSQNHPVEQKLIDFVHAAATENKEIIYLFIPRSYDENQEKYNFPENVIFYPKLNVYEIVWHVNVHATVFSTLALEAPTIGKPNILINLNGLSKHYFGSVLPENKVNEYLNSTAAFLKAIPEKSKLKKGEVIRENANLIASDYDNNIERFINETIK